MIEQKNYRRDHKNQKNREPKKDNIGVWTPDSEKEEKENRKKNDYKRKNYNPNPNPEQGQRKDKIPKEKITEVIEYCTLLSVEQYFEDIGKESESFITLSKRVGFVKPDFVERIQRYSDKIMEQEIKKCHKDFITSKVEITNYKRSIKVTNGLETYLFVPKYEKGKLSITTYHKIEDKE